jgi:hypothetical protein
MFHLADQRDRGIGRKTCGSLLAVQEYCTQIQK